MYAPCDGLVDVWVGGDGVEGGGEFFLVVKDRCLRKRRRRRERREKEREGERRREKERETKSEREKEKGKENGKGKINVQCGRNNTSSLITTY